MVKLFDYVFFRIYEYYKSYGSDLTHQYSSGLVSLIQGLTIVTGIGLTSLVWPKLMFTKNYYALFIFIPIMIINWYRYERNFSYEKWSEKWKNEKKHLRTRKGWLIVVYYAFVIIALIFVAFLRYNLGVI